MVFALCLIPKAFDSSDKSGDKNPDFQLLSVNIGRQTAKLSITWHNLPTENRAKSFFYHNSWNSLACCYFLVYFKWISMQIFHSNPRKTKSRWWNRPMNLQNISQPRHPDTDQLSLASFPLVFLRTITTELITVRSLSYWNWLFCTGNRVEIKAWTCNCDAAHMQVHFHCSTRSPAKLRTLELTTRRLLTRLIYF
jgi:hypothetical protein